MKIKVAYNTIVQTLGRVVGSLATFAITILVAGKFGVAGYGEFTEIVAYVALFYMVADFGMNAIVVRESGEEERVWFSNLLGLRIFWGLLLVFLALAIAIFLPYDNILDIGFSNKVKLGIVLGSGMILTSAIVTTCNGVFQKHLDYGKALLGQIVGSLVTVLAVWVFVSLGFGLEMIVLGHVAGGGVMALLAVILARTYIKKLRLWANFEIWRKIILQSLPLGLVLVFNLIYFRIDVLMLAYFKGSSDVGIYGLGYKFFELILALPTFFMNSIYPVMIDYGKESKERLKGLIEGSFIFLLIGSLGSLVVVWFGAPLVVGIIGKSGFENSVGVLRILGLGLPFFFTSSLFMWYFITIKKQNLLIYIYGLGMAVNIVLNFIFIPLYSYWASSVITGICEGGILMALGFFGYRYLYGGKNGD